MDERHVAEAGWWRGRVRSFGYAFRGLAICFRTQANARIHAVATVLVVALGFALKLAAWEWCAVVLSIASVWAAELAVANVILFGYLTTTQPHPPQSHAQSQSE